jgi:hypothetical protein
LPAKIFLKQSIEIKASAEKIYDYIADLNNDHIWRPEVEKMEVLEEGKLGTLAIEYITVYAFFHMTTPVQIMKMNRPFEYEIETRPEHPYWVHCIRSIKKLDEEHSSITVELSFTLDNLKQAFPILPPKQFVFWWYNPRMKKYLKNLKRMMENN